MIGFLIALISGALMSVQGVFNTALTKNSSIWVANIWVQLTALLVCFVAWLVSDRGSFEGIWTLQPKYMLTGGVIGAFITYTVIVSMNQLGPARAVLFIVVSQIIIAYLIEVMGIWGVEKQTLTMRSVIGMIVAVIGVAIFKW
jgi:transporter family-2 protein